MCVSVLCVIVHKYICVRDVSVFMCKSMCGWMKLQGHIFMCVLACVAVCLRVTACTRMCKHM